MNAMRDCDGSVLAESWLTTDSEQRAPSVRSTVPVDSRYARCCADWEAVHRDYRAGLKSLREIAAERGVSHTAIRKRAKRDGWERDLARRIKTRTEALLAGSLVTKTQVSSEVSTETAVWENAFVEVNAQARVQVRQRHRLLIAHASKLWMQMLDDVDALWGAESLLKILAEVVATGSCRGRMDAEKLRAKLLKALDLSTRAAMVKTLVDVLAKLVALERQAYSLDVEPRDADVEGFSNWIDGWLAST